MVGSVTYREPEFTPDQVALLLAHEQGVADLGPHGHPLSEAMSSLADPSSPDAQWKYVARDKPRIDRAARVLGEAQDAFKEKYFKDKPLPHGYHFAVDRVDL